LAQRAASHKDYLIAQLLINGATAGFNSYDGVTFFNTSHVSGASGEQSNDLTYPAAADEGLPNLDEMRGALQQAITHMLGFRDDQGEPILLDSGGLVCVVPPAMLFTALEVMNATLVN